MENANTNTSSAVAFMTFPFGTHSAPLFSLASALASASATTFYFYNSSRSNNSFRGRPGIPPNLRLCDVEDGWPVGRPPSKDPEEEVRLFVGVSPGNFQAAMETEGRKVSCIVSDAFLWFAGEMAAELGVPWVPVWTGGPASLVAHLNSDLLRAKFLTPEGQVATKEDEPLTCIPCLSSFQLRDLPEGIVSGDPTSVFSAMLDRATAALLGAQAIIVNTFAGLDPDIDAELQTRFSSYLPVGPVNLLSPKPVKPDRHSSLSWLDSRAPATVAYVSFGTLISPPPSELAELAMGLDSCNVSFVWSLKDELRVHLPAGFLDRTVDRGLVVPWVPQVEVLCHVAVGAFLTHCGWNSVLEGIAGGVPMVCRPFLGDQRINARVVSHLWSIGLTIEGGVLTYEGVTEAFEKIVKGTEGKIMRERAKRLSDLAIQAVQTGGISIQKFNELLKLVG